MRVLVVGGTGNISRGVVRALLEFGHEVAIFNRGLTVGPVPAGVRVLRGDRQDRETFEARMREERFDAAIDMICYTAADAASDVRAFRGVKHFIQISTVATFGGPLAERPTGPASPLRPVIPYSRDKVAADEVLLAAQARGELPLTIFKPAQTWGYQPFLLRQLGRDPRWLDRVRRGKPILVTHEGELIWPHLHADDAGVAIAAAVGRERCLGQTYILTSPRLTTWREYHEEIAVALGHPITLIDAPAEWLIANWPENTRLLASESRWNRLYDLGNLLRDIPEFRPTIRLGDRVPEIVAHLEASGLIEDSRLDETEDRLIARIETFRKHGGSEE